MAAPIVVDIVSGEASGSELAALLVDACSRAVSGGGCVLNDPKRSGTSFTAFAVVSLDGPTQRHLRVDVASLNVTGGTLRSRIATAPPG